MPQNAMSGNFNSFRVETLGGRYFAEFAWKFNLRAGPQVMQHQ